ncbi:MAG TPA: biotin--[acetyl-CoA-carboxylase] ligase [Burkholderiaceae bacterium]|jgi:BirA family biotin operon repressor/biotin-[acetyl-CoA-carboxylase] ligase|nr:biotin--[acetyl-CoA-carboxylase] ligase [Burkholderiaceae bacterium]
MSGSKTTGRAPGQLPLGSGSASLFDAPLSGEAIERALGMADSVRVQVVEQTGSTNDDLLELARLAAPDQPTVRAALHQFSGRGRHGRRWHDARGRALLFSVMTSWMRDPAAASAVTLACGISVAEALRVQGIEARLKWPNDLLLSDRKLGGILTELAFDALGRASLVVGVGLNLCLDPETRVAIDQPAAALDERIVETRLASERENWIGLLARAVLQAIGRFEAEGFAPFRARFEGLFAYAGRPVVVLQAGLPTLAGVPIGVDGEGRLLLSTESGIEAVASGELSLRPAVA